jgi:hypothetical protein
MVGWRPPASSCVGSAISSVAIHAARIAAVNEWLEAVDLVLLRPPVLSRAGEPMAMPIGTLDAIHLATALMWRERVGALPEMLTHDAALGAAARAFGFDVRGTTSAGGETRD